MMIKPGLLSIEKGVRFTTALLIGTRNSALITDLPSVWRSKRLKLRDIVGINQIHSPEIVCLPDESFNYHKYRNGDGLVTKKRDIALTVVTADCAPIFAYDLVEGVIGIAHSGWKGALNNIIYQLISAMVKEGALQRNIKAVIGPAIGKCCYDIYTERTELFTKRYPFLKDKIIEKRKSQDYLNLQKLHKLQLLHASVSEENITAEEYCTTCNPEQFYSYKRGDRKRRMVHGISLHHT